MSIIEVKNLTKEYQLGSIVSLKQSAVNAFNKLTGRPVVERERFKALDDINFTIDEGEVVGIIGANGAGKSTLLKHLASITTPTKGEVIVRGSIAPLIEVGAGVNPELTGRENIFLNGAILGIPKKIIQQKLDEIIAFSELEQFIDTPVKRYSSGMTVRLGFSIATTLDADILIVDEVLAVGDLSFQRKCFDRMEGLIKKQGTTVLLVSHNIRQVERICDRAIMLEHGKVLLDDNSRLVCSRFYQKTTNKLAVSDKSINAEVIHGQQSSGEVEVLGVTIANSSSGHDNSHIVMHDPVEIRVEFIAKKELINPEIVVGFHTPDFVYVVSTSTATTKNNLNFKKGKHYFKCILDDLVLRPGTFSIRLAFIDNARRMMWYAEKLSSFTVGIGAENMAKMPEVGLIDLPFKWHFEE